MDLAAVTHFWRTDMAGICNNAEHDDDYTKVTESMDWLIAKVERLQLESNSNLLAYRSAQADTRTVKAELAAEQSLRAAAEGEVERLKGIVERCNNVLSTVPALEFDAADESDLAQSQIALFDIALIINAIPTKEPK